MQSLQASALDLITAIRHGIAAELLGWLLIILSWFQELLSLPQNKSRGSYSVLRSDEVDSMAVNGQFRIDEEIVNAVSLFSILRPAISAGRIRMAKCRHLP